MTKEILPLEIGCNRATDHIYLYVMASYSWGGSLEHFSHYTSRSVSQIASSQIIKMSSPNLQTGNCFIAFPVKWTILKAFFYTVIAKSKGMRERNGSYLKSQIGVQQLFKTSSGLEVGFNKWIFNHTDLKV